jgi:hypothetical protein
MNRARSTGVVLLTVLLAGIAIGQESPKRFARTTCLVKISHSEGSEQTKVIGALANTAAVTGKASADVLGLNEPPQVTWDGIMYDVLQLSTDLPVEASSKAGRFWTAVAANLDKATGQLCEQQAQQLREQLELAERQKAEALARLQVGPSMSRSDQAVQEQLDKRVDLSGLRRGMPLAEAIEVLRQSVNPALKIMVLWRDLAEKADVPEATPIDLDGVNPMKLEMGLRLVVKDVSDRGRGGEQAIDYTLDGGVAVVATKETLKSLRKGPSEGAEPLQSVDDLSVTRRGLINQAQEAEMDSLRLRARRMAMEEQAAELRKRIDQALDQDVLIRELQKLVDTMAQAQARVQALIEKGMAPQAQMDEAVERLVKAKIELARQREITAQAAGGEQLSKLMAGLSELAVQAAEREAILPILRDQISRVDAQLNQAQTSIPRAIERDLALKSLRQAEEQIQSLRQNLMSMQPATITVIGAGN